MTDKTQEHNPLSLFEFWPGSLFYTPIVLYWMAMGVRYRDLLIATAANPRIETGGLCGESKSSILDMGGPTAQKAIAPYRVFRSGKDALARAVAAMEELNLSFPVVVKPDIGCNGTGVKLVENHEMLVHVLSLFPENVSLLIQKLVPYPVEAGIFYIRHPGETMGRLTSITYKETPVLVGDGSSTMEELVMKDPRMSQVPQIYLPRIKGEEDTILPQGEERSLVFTGNHRKGSIFRDGCHDATEALTQRVNAIMTDIPDFHFGRIDVKAMSADALRRGEGFEIIEINGVGSEAIHIWDRRTTLWDAYKTQFYHYRQTFLIGAAKKKEGWKSTGVISALRSWIKQRRLLASYPVND